MLMLASFWNVVQIYNLGIVWGLGIAVVLTILLIVLAQAFRKIKETFVGVLVLVACFVLFCMQGTLLSGAIVASSHAHEVRESWHSLKENPIKTAVSLFDEMFAATDDGKKWDGSFNKVELVLEYVDADDLRLTDVLELDQFVTRQLRLSMIKHSAWVLVTFVLGLVLYIFASGTNIGEKGKRRSTTPKSYQMDIDF